jgi:hypothetical protein
MRKKRGTEQSVPLLTANKKLGFSETTSGISGVEKPGFCAADSYFPKRFLNSAFNAGTIWNRSPTTP